MACICLLARDAATMGESKFRAYERIAIRVLRTVLACGRSKPALDLAVLERVKRDDSEPAAWGEHAESGLHGGVELSELIIDGHAECLEGSRCGMSAAVAVA